jgi:hypothetical protein
MERARVRTRQLPPLQRGFERSRLEAQLIASAYELALPPRRQPLTSKQDRQKDEVPPHLPSASKGGLSA